MQSLKENNSVTTNIGLFFVAIMLLFSSCNQKSFDTKQELANYLKDEFNGYIQHKTINGVDYTLMYRPTDLLVHQELGDKQTTTTEIQQLREKYSKYMYFNLSISMNNQELLSVAPKDRNEFGAMVNQLAFGMGEKVHLYTQKRDTLELADYIYPRMYGMGRSTTMMFVYPRNKEKLETETLNFTIEDLGLYTGEIKFKMDTEKIKSEPQLAFKS